MTRYDIAPGVDTALQRFIVPDKLGFGLVAAPVMFSAEWSEGEWRRGQLLPHGPIEILPGARALHYAELVFEGMKAYQVDRSWPNLFRPVDHCRRMARSAQRMSMPVVPEELFLQALDAVAGVLSPFVPGKSGQALYLRPFLLGTEPGYLVRNSNSFRFMVIANPVEAYASGPMRVAIERKDVRAAVGGLGDIKTPANYAASLRASSRAVASGHSVALWLDAAEHRYVQELSGMNLFAVLDGEMHTPALDGAILPGITRDSLITLARSLGLRVQERLLPIEELLRQITNGECSEVFASGTGAIVNPIGAMIESDGKEYVPRNVDIVAARMREALLAIQERRATDPFGWTRDVATFNS